MLNPVWEGTSKHKKISTFVKLLEMVLFQIQICFRWKLYRFLRGPQLGSLRWWKRILQICEALFEPVGAKAGRKLPCQLAEEDRQVELEKLMYKHICNSVSWKVVLVEILQLGFLFSWGLREGCKMRARNAFRKNGRIIWPFFMHLIFGFSSFGGCTLPETNIAPKNRWLEY